jgi:hypothetical protein
VRARGRGRSGGRTAEERSSPPNWASRRARRKSDCASARRVHQRPQPHARAHARRWRASGRRWLWAEADGRCCRRRWLWARPTADAAGGTQSSWLTWYKLAALEVRTCRQVMPLHPYTPGGRFEASGRLEYFFPLSPTGGPRGPRGGYGGQGRMPLHPYTPGGRFEASGRLEYFFPFPSFSGQWRMFRHNYFSSTPIKKREHKGVRV